MLLHAPLAKPESIVVQTMKETNATTATLVNTRTNPIRLRRVQSYALNAQQASTRTAGERLLARHARPVNTKLQLVGASVQTVRKTRFLLQSGVQVSVQPAAMGNTRLEQARHIATRNSADAKTAQGPKEVPAQTTTIGSVPLATLHSH